MQLIASNPINTDQKLNRVMNRISDNLAEIQHDANNTPDKLTKEFMGKFNDWLTGAITNVETYVNRHNAEEKNNILGKLTRFREMFTQVQHQVRQGMTSEKAAEQQKTKLDEWKKQRTQEIQQQHDAWDKHIQGRPARMAEIERQKVEDAKNPINSIRKLRKETANLERFEVSDEETAAEKQNRQANVDRFLSRPENRANPQDEKLYQKYQAMDAQIKELSDALLILQKAVPALSSMAKYMAQAMAEFQLSARDERAFYKLDMACGMLLNKEVDTKDPLVQRMWHSFVTTIKAFLGWLDCLQSKLTGKKIDQPGREHKFMTPTLPVHEAKNNFRQALDHMNEEMEKLLSQGKKSAPRA